MRSHYESIQDNELIKFQYQMMPLNVFQLQQIIKDAFNSYFSTMSLELRDLTDYIEDRQSPESILKIQEVKELFQIDKEWKQIHEQILTVIEDKCDGNPLASIEFAYNLIAANHVDIQEVDKCLVPNQLFEESKFIDHWVKVDAPQLFDRINTTQTDKLTRVLASV